MDARFAGTALVASTSTEAATDGKDTSDPETDTSVPDNRVVPGQDVAVDRFLVNDAHPANPEPSDGMNGPNTARAVTVNVTAEAVFVSAASSLVASLLRAFVFLLVIYRVLADHPSLAVATMVPIVAGVVALVSTIRLLAIPLNNVAAGHPGEQCGCWASRSTA
jgi:predicted RND superfamily exporter protein